MLSPELKQEFPFRQLEPYEEDMIAAMYGGLPPADRKTIDEAFSTYAEPMLGDYWLGKVLRASEKGCLAVVESDHNEVTKREAFRSGVYFYAAIVSALGRTMEIPCELTVVQKIFNKWHEDFIHSAYNRADEEVPSVCRLIDASQETLGIQDTSLRHIAVVGAGVVHIVNSRSMIVRHGTTTFESAHPELKEMDELFREIDLEVSYKKGHGPAA